MNNDTSLWQEQLGPAVLCYNCAVSDVTQHTPYFLHFGRRPRLPIHRALQGGEPIFGRLHDLYEALRAAQQLTLDSRKHNRERLARKANVGGVEVGDSVVIKAEEPLTLTSKWEPQWVVTQVRGKALWLTHQHTGKQKILNREKVRVVDPEIIWDELRPRPKRRANVRGAAIRPWQLPPQMPAPAPALPKPADEDVQPLEPEAATPEDDGPAHPRDVDHSSMEEAELPATGVEIPLPESEDWTSSDDEPLASTARGRRRPHSTDSGGDKTEGRVETRHSDKRLRPFLPRGTKRTQRYQDEDSPPPRRRRRRRRKKVKPGELLPGQSAHPESVIKRKASSDPGYSDDHRREPKDVHKDFTLIKRAHPSSSDEHPKYQRGEDTSSDGL